MVPDNFRVVHEEWNSILVPSSHGANIFYRVFLGSVNWDKIGGGEKTAYTVLIQYGNSRNWEDAKKRREIDFTMPAHILEEDLDTVLNAIGSLRENRAKEA